MPNKKAANTLDQQRHTLAHLLAGAVKELYPEVKLAIGPTIETGFYYDFDDIHLGEADLPRLEDKMRQLLKRGGQVKHWTVKVREAEKQAVSEGQIYKVDLIRDLAAGGETEVSYYQVGDLVDLCAGPHVSDLSDIKADSFKLDKIAGAYWRGSEKNKMLTRVYGLAFADKETLDNYLAMAAAAEARDHRKLGKELGLFVFSETVGKGLPLLTAKGAAIRRELERFIVDEELKRGYQHVITPDLARLELYKKSGHYPYYKDSMYAPIKIDEEEFMLRPMACPHHFELYLSQPRSWRDLPFRIAELAKLYRYEQSGELTGLMRARVFCLADAHIICADAEQAKDEAAKVLDLIDYLVQTFGLKPEVDYWYRLSLGDRGDQSKYYQDDQAWATAEANLRQVLQARGAKFAEAPGEAAFYGPKIDVQMRNVNGKEDTAFTVQYDFVMPGRFHLAYIDRDGQEREGIVIHRSSIGALERIMAFLIEYYAGAFPLWLSPVQIKLLPVGQDHLAHCQKLADELRGYGWRVAVDDADETVGKKTRQAIMEKVPYILVIGAKEIASNNLTVRLRGQDKTVSLAKEEFVTKIKQEIAQKALASIL